MHLTCKTYRAYKINYYLCSVKQKAVVIDNMKTIEIEKSWHKATDKIAMTYAQKQYIDDLSNEDNLVGWDFRSTTNAQRSLTKFDASEIIEVLKSGGRVIIK